MMGVEDDEVLFPPAPPPRCVPMNPSSSANASSQGNFADASYSQDVFDAAEVHCIFGLVLADMRYLLQHNSSLIAQMEQMASDVKDATFIRAHNSEFLKALSFNYEEPSDPGDRLAYLSVRQQYRTFLDQQRPQNKGFSSVARDLYTNMSPPPVPRNRNDAHVKTSVASTNWNGRGSTFACSYEFSPEIRSVALNRFLHSLGLNRTLDLKTVHEAAIVIQRAYRNYRNKRYFEQCYIQRRKKSCELNSHVRLSLHNHRSATKNMVDTEAVRPQTESPMVPKRLQNLSRVPPPAPPPRKSSECRLNNQVQRSSAQQFLTNVCSVRGAGHFETIEDVSSSRTLTSSGLLVDMVDSSNAVRPPIFNHSTLPEPHPYCKSGQKTSPCEVSKQPEGESEDVLKKNHSSVSSSDSNSGSDQLTNYINIDDYISATGVFSRTTNRSSTYSEHTNSGSDEGVEQNVYAGSALVSNYQQWEPNYGYSYACNADDNTPMCSPGAVIDKRLPHQMSTMTLRQQDVTFEGLEPPLHALNSSHRKSNVALTLETDRFNYIQPRSVGGMGIIDKAGSGPGNPDSNWTPSFPSPSLQNHASSRISPSTPVKVRRAEQARGQDAHLSVLGSGVSADSRNSTHFLNSGLKSGMGTMGRRSNNFLSEQLAPLYNCKIVGCKYSPRQELTLRVGLYLFNKDPKKGIKFLTERGFLEPNSPEDLAYMFACYKRGLNKTQVGEYLGSEKAFNCQVLKSFVELNRPRFEKKQIDEALRSFLPMFKLPGESQKIDRILMHFGHVYALMNEPIALMLGDGGAGSMSQEERIARGASAAHVLAYAVMILNTDLHNSNVQSSMSLKDFRKNCRRSDELKHLDDAFLEGIYKRIKNNQFAQAEDNSTAVALFAKNLKDFHKNLILDEPFRFLVAVCPFNYVPDTRNLRDNVELHLFLFNDLLIAASKDQMKKKAAKNSPGGDLLSVLAQSFTYKFDVALLNLQIDMFDTRQPPTANNAKLGGSTLWGLTLTSGEYLQSNQNGRNSFTFVCSNQEDMLKFSRDLRNQVRDMTVIEQLRVQDNFETAELRSSCRNKSNSIDSLLDPPLQSNPMEESEETRNSSRNFYRQPSQTHHAYDCVPVPPLHDYNNTSNRGDICSRQISAYR